MTRPSGLTDEGRRKAAAKTNAITIARSQARAAMARDLRSQGWTTDKIAHHMDMSVHTIRAYLRRPPKHG